MSIYFILYELFNECYSLNNSYNCRTAIFLPPYSENPESINMGGKAGMPAVDNPPAEI